MTTTKHQSMQAGQALVLDRGVRQLLVLRGEVVLQPPARWLAGTVVLPPARRIPAPACVAIAEGGSVAARTDARIALEEAASLLAWLLPPRRKCLKPA